MKNSQPNESWIGRSFEVDIEKVAHGGIFVARHEGRVVFVNHVLPGERAKVRVYEDRGKGFCRAEPMAILTASPDRVAHVWPDAEFDIAGEVDEYYLFEEPDKPEDDDSDDELDFALVLPDETIDLAEALSTSLIMETPFGTDLESAKSLNAVVQEVFDDLAGEGAGLGRRAGGEAVRALDGFQVLDQLRHIDHHITVVET